MRLILSQNENNNSHSRYVCNIFKRAIANAKGDRNLLASAIALAVQSARVLQ